MATELEIHDGRKFYRINGGLLGMPADLKKALAMCEGWMREVDGQRCLPVGYVSVNLRRELMNRLVDLQDTLGGGPDDEIVESVTTLLDAFPASQMKDPEKATERLKTYLGILRELPAWSVSSVVRRFTIGESGKGEFCPSPAQIYQLALKDLTHNKDEYRRIKVVVDAPTHPSIEGPWWVKVPKEDRDRVQREREGTPDASGRGKDGKTREERAAVVDRLMQQWNASRSAPGAGLQSAAEAAQKAARAAWLSKRSEETRVGNLKAKGFPEDSPHSAEWLIWQSQDQEQKKREAAEEILDEDGFEEPIPF